MLQLYFMQHVTRCMVVRTVTQAIIWGLVKKDSLDVDNSIDLCFLPIHVIRGTFQPSTIELDPLFVRLLSYDTITDNGASLPPLMPRGLQFESQFGLLGILARLNIPAHATDVYFNLFCFNK